MRLVKQLMIWMSVETLLWFLMAEITQADVFLWPQIVPLQKSVSFPDARQAEATLEILGVDGKPLYLLQCHTKEYEGDRAFVYSGDFECRLKSLYELDKYSTLLTEDPLQSRDWESRARVFAEELLGACGRYPEYGRVRHFRLRRMRLTFEFSDLRFERRSIREVWEGKPAELRSFHFGVRVEPDPGALSTIAEPAPFAEPPSLSEPLYTHPEAPKVSSRRCDVVVSQHVPGVVSENYIQVKGLGPPYPRIIPTGKTLTFPEKDAGLQSEEKPAPADRWYFYLPVLNASRELAYEFECSTSKTKGGNRVLIGRWGIWCGLFIVGEKVNLLRDSIDPYSRMNRAEVYAEQLYGKCADYPEWGAVRHFRLRGMNLTVQFKNPLFAGDEGLPDYFMGGLKGFELSVRVDPDSTAESPVAESSPYIDWRSMSKPNACEKILVRAPDGSLSQ